MTPTLVSLLQYRFSKFMFIMSQNNKQGLKNNWCEPNKAGLEGSWTTVTIEATAMFVHFYWVMMYADVIRCDKRWELILQRFWNSRFWIVRSHNGWENVFFFLAPADFYFEFFMNRFFCCNLGTQFLRYCNVCSLLLIHNRHGRGRGRELGHGREHGREHWHGREHGRGHGH